MKRLLVVAVLLLGVVVAGSLIARRQRASDLRRVAATQTALEDGVLRTVILGDSVARGAGDESGGDGIAGALRGQLQSRGPQPAMVANLGINGARTGDVRRLLGHAAARSAVRTADVIVLSAGGNDLYGDSRARLFATLLPGRAQARTIARVQRVVATLREANPAARIYLLGLYNPYRHSSAGAWIDRQVNLWDARLIGQFAADRGVTVVRICDLLRRDDRISRLDHFHPGAGGYAAIAERIASSL
ncbi:MAG TPA: GDSL-type esterase/lipase family protein [Thermoanaerobaculia bacterium]|nr:GDSL-type esterase/lipase family protein [Thermoanaerobaculia bacterium]